MEAAAEKPRSAGTDAGHTAATCQAPLPEPPSHPSAPQALQLPWPVAPTWIAATCPHAGGRWAFRKGLVWAGVAPSRAGAGRPGCLNQFSSSQERYEASVVLVGITV